MKLRFSLRGLLLLTVCLAVFLYWRDRPRQIANRYVAAIEAGDYKLADSMVDNQWVGVTHKPADMDAWKALRKEQLATDWLRGRCYVYVTGDLARFRFSHQIVATATGMQTVDIWRIVHTSNVPPRWTLEREKAKTTSPLGDG